MSQGVWKVDDDDQAVYIDIEEERTEDLTDKPYGYWCNLPDLLLEKIFSYLTIRERYYASMVCRSWYRAFHLPYVWYTFVLEDHTLTRRKYNLYYGWQHVLDHLRVHMCFMAVGQNIRRLVFEPMMNFYNLFEFMNMVSFFIEHKERQDIVIGSNIRSLKYTFPCNMEAPEEAEGSRTYGTGGKLLEALKRLMGNLPSLRRLELIDLLLESREAQHLLDEVCSACCLTMHTLVIINVTKYFCQLLHIGVFLKLQVLIISPQNLGEELLELLQNTTLRHLHIVQNRYTPVESMVKYISAKSWYECRKANPELSVHFEMNGVKNREIVWQEKAPARSIIYDSPYIQITTESVLTVIDLYCNDLWIYGHTSLPKFESLDSFHERADSLLLLMCRNCQYLHTLVVRERISTSTVLLMAHTARNLHHLYVRRNEIVVKCDWPKSPEWTEEFYEWLISASKSHESVEKEVSQMFGYRWTMQTDKQFNLLSIDVHKSIY